jgi:hypothetical protein
LSSTTTKNLEGQDDSVSITRRCVDSARDALRQAEAENVETEKRRETFIEILKAGKSLPNGKALAGVDDERTLSAIKIDGLVEALADAEEDHAVAVAVADDIADQVRDLVAPLTTGNRIEETTQAVAELLIDLALKIVTERPVELATSPSAPWAARPSTSAGRPTRIRIRSGWSRRSSQISIYASEGT